MVNITEGFDRVTSMRDNLTIRSPELATDWSRGARYESCSNIEDKSQPPESNRNNEVDIV